MAVAWYQALLAPAVFGLHPGCSDQTMMARRTPVMLRAVRNGVGLGDPG